MRGRSSVVVAAGRAEPCTVTVTAEGILVILVAVAVLAAVADRLALPDALVYVAGGLAVSFVPGSPSVAFDAEVVFLVLFPVMLFGAAWSTSWNDFRPNLRVIVVLSVGLVVVTTVTVAGVARLVVPGVTWPVALLLGVILADPDTSMFRRAAASAGVPRPLAAVMHGEGLVEGTASLILYVGLAAAVVSGELDPVGLGVRFLVAPVVGIAVGLAVAWVIGWIAVRNRDATVGITLSLAAPFAAYLPAQALGGARIPAVVAAGLYLGWHSRAGLSAAARVSGAAVWDTLRFLVQGFVYIPLGLALRDIFEARDGRSLASLGVQVAVLALTVIVVRVAVVLGAQVMRRTYSRIRHRAPAVPWSHVIVGAWAPTRGTFAMASAIALPLTLADGAPFPDRELIVMISLGVVLATTAVQGLSLPRLVRALDLHDDGRDAREEALVWQQTAVAAIERLASLQGQDIADLRDYYIDRAQRFAGELQGEGSGLARMAGQLDTRRALLEVERHRVRELRDSDTISDAVARRVERKLDEIDQYLE